jgi:hypothetical protein
MAVMVAGRAGLRLSEGVWRMPCPARKSSRRCQVRQFAQKSTLSGFLSRSELESSPSERHVNIMNLQLEKAISEVKQMKLRTWEGETDAVVKKMIAVVEALEVELRQIRQEHEDFVKSLLRT